MKLLVNRPAVSGLPYTIRPLGRLLGGVHEASDPTTAAVSEGRRSGIIGIATGTVADAVASLGGVLIPNARKTAESTSRSLRFTAIGFPLSPALFASPDPLIVHLKAST